MIENYCEKLHIHPSVAPVAQRERQIPLALLNKMNEELKWSENEDIIENGTGETNLNPFRT